MYIWRNWLTPLMVAVSLATTGCGGDADTPTHPGGMPAGPSGFISVSPRGGAVEVPAGTMLEVRWGVGMGSGMEQFIDLHMDNLSGPITSMSCIWSGDRTTLFCTPVSPLQSQRSYLVHVGGGMVDVNGNVVDLLQSGPAHGGQWIHGGMMGASHGGMDWAGMDSHWRHANGSAGMAFSFTTSS